MSKPDGTILFSTLCDNSELEKQVEDAKKEVESIEGKLKELNKDRTSALKEQQKAQEKLTKAQKEYNTAIEKQNTAQKKVEAARTALADAEAKQQDILSGLRTSKDADEKTRLSKELNDQMDTVSQAMAELDAAESAPNYSEEVAAAAQSVEAATADLREAEAAVHNIDASISSANSALEAAETNAGNLGNQFKAAEEKSQRMQKPIDSASKSVDRFMKRLKRMALNAAVFSVIAKGLSALKDRLSDAIEANEEASAAMAQLGGAAKTAAQPIINLLVPALTSLAQALTRTIVLTGSLFGKDFVKDASDAAQALDKVKKAKQSLAGFDEINIIGNKDEESSSSSYDFNDVISGETEESIKSLARLTADLAIAIGCVLMFSGVSIPLGLALIVFGAVSWVSEIKEDWGASENKVSIVAESMLYMLGKFLLVIGCVLCFAGVSLPIGLAMIVAGAAVEAVVINWDTVEEALRGPIGLITALVSGALLVLGALLLLSGVGVGIGLGLILAGSLGLGTVAMVNWDKIVNIVKSILKFLKDAITDAIKTVFNVVITTLTDLLSAAIKILNGIITFIAGVFTGDWEKAWDGIKGIFSGIWNGMLAIVGNIVNSVISGLNWMIRQVNKISVDIPDWGIFGEYAGGKIGFDFEEIPKWNIPYLAQGAVIPANQEFLAVLDDQKHGTNVEAPLTTTQEAVRTELVAMFGDGFGTIDARLLAILEAIYGIDTSDERYARAVSNYNRREAIMGGV